MCGCVAITRHWSRKGCMEESSSKGQKTPRQTVLFACLLSGAKQIHPKDILGRGLWGIFRIFDMFLTFTQQCRGLRIMLCKGFSQTWPLLTNIAESLPWPSHNSRVPANARLKPRRRPLFRFGDTCLFCSFTFSGAPTVPRAVQVGSDGRSRSPSSFQAWG